MAVLLWSVNAIVTKMTAGAIDPAVISFYRWLPALLVMTPFVLPNVLRHRRIIFTHGWRLLVLPLLGMVLYQSLAYYAAHSVTARFIGILNSLIPLLTVLFSVVLLRAAPTVGVLIGTLLSFCGLGFLLAPDIGLNARNIPMVMFAGIAASLVAPYIWIQGVMRLGANTASIFMNLAPVFTAFIAVLFLHEGLHSYHVIGGGITLCGVVLAQRLRIPLLHRARGAENAFLTHRATATFGILL